MHLVAVSHKLCWPSPRADSGFGTDGGFPLQMGVISELFTSTTIVVPCTSSSSESGLTPLIGKNLRIVSLTLPRGQGLRRKLGLPLWLAKNGTVIWREIRRADAVHAPIPGDVGTIGLIAAMLMRKPLFVRHCGNWFVQKTTAERFWKWLMERFAGGRNVMLATGGAPEPPSRRNPKIAWIFSTSLRSDQMAAAEPLNYSNNEILRLIIVCRQEPNKGTEMVIDSMPLVQKTFPGVTLDIVGGGSLLDALRQQAAKLGLTDRVRFHGKIEQAKVLDLLKRSHVFCYPTSASEGFPKVVLEALACGLPIATTRVSVLPELLKSGCGVLLDETTPEALAEAVKKIASDGGEYERMSRHALETVREYTLEKWRDEIGQKLRTAWNTKDLSYPV